MASEQCKRLHDWINYNSRNDDMITSTDGKNYTRQEALDDLYDLENLAHPNDNPFPPEKLSPPVDTGLSMPVMQYADSFRINRPEAVKQIMEILDVTVGDKVRILESLVLMYTKDE